MICFFEIMLWHGQAVYGESFAQGSESSTRKMYLFIKPDQMDDQTMNPAEEPKPIATPVEPAQPVEPEAPEATPAA